ncbi:hypothetical protein ACLOJK_034599, partial [Asimina triloba]
EHGSMCTSEHLTVLHHLRSQRRQQQSSPSLTSASLHLPQMTPIEGSQRMHHQGVIFVDTSNESDRGIKRSSGDTNIIFINLHLVDELPMRTDRRVHATDL